MLHQDRPALLVSVLALLVAAGSLLLAVNEGSEQRAFLRLQAQPSLRATIQMSDVGFRVTLYNNGPGIAKLRYFRVTVDGKPISDWKKLVEALGFDWDKINPTFAQPYPGEIFPPTGYKEGINLLWVDTSANFAAFAHQFSKRAGFEYCFCSIFNECWADYSLRGQCSADEQGTIRTPPDFFESSN